MKNQKILTGVFLCSLLAGCEKDPVTSITETAPQSKITPAGPDAQVIANQYIVELDEDFGDVALKSAAGIEMAQEAMKTEISSLLAADGFTDVELGSVYTQNFRGFVVKIRDAAQLSRLENLKAVKHIEQDQIFTVIQKKENDLPYAKAQTLSYGISRVGSASGAGKRAWIVDTGIDMDHPDLNVNATLSKSFVYAINALGLVVATSPEDGNGHGTHCAGIIAAKNNDYGTKGVAYDAEVVSIKVLADNGSGSTSGIISGLDYIASVAKPGEVVNMSLGGGVSPSLDKAVIRTAGKGIWFAIAAGNSRSNTLGTSPARVNGSYIFTVSAMGSGDIWAPYSNYGNPPIDFCAPGSYIYSTYKNGSYATLSGTSMATPHVSGILLIRGKPLTSGRVKSDPDGNADYIAHL